MAVQINHHPLIPPRSANPFQGGKWKALTRPTSLTSLVRWWFHWTRKCMAASPSSLAATHPRKFPGMTLVRLVRQLPNPFCPRSRTNLMRTKSDSEIQTGSLTNYAVRTKWLFWIALLHRVSDQNSIGKPESRTTYSSSVKGKRKACSEFMSDKKETVFKLRVLSRAFKDLIERLWQSWFQSFLMIERDCAINYEIAIVIVIVWIRNWLAITILIVQQLFSA